MSRDAEKEAPAGEDHIQLDHALSPANSLGTKIKGDTQTPSKCESEENFQKLTGIRWAAVVISILSSTFLYALDNTIVANIRPSIIKSLGQIEKLPWVSVAYAAGEVGSNPFWYNISILK